MPVSFLSTVDRICSILCDLSLSFAAIRNDSCIVLLKLSWKSIGTFLVQSVSFCDKQLRIEFSLGAVLLLPRDAIAERGKCYHHVFLPTPWLNGLTHREPLFVFNAC